MRYVLIVLMFLVTTVGAEDLTTLDSLRVAAMRSLNQPDGGNDNITKAEAITAVNRAIQVVSTEFPAFEVVDTITTTKNTIAYSLDSNYVATIWCITSNGKPVVGVRVVNDQLFFTPTRADGETYYFAYNAVATKLATDGATTNIRPAYRDQVVLYTCYLLSKQRNRLADAQSYLEEYGRLKQ